MQMKLLENFSVDLEAKSQLLVIYFVFVKHVRKNGNKMKQWISYL